MSTVGKVLSVLVMLVAAAWVVLSAGVAQLNRNGTKAVEDLKKQISQFESDVSKAERDVHVFKEEQSLQMDATQAQLRVLQSKQADVEKARSEVIEIASRVTLQLANVEATVKSSEALRDLRVAEHKAEIEAKAEAEKGVETLKEERTKLIDQLTELRTKFKTTLDENRSLVGRLRGKDGVPSTRAGNRPTRPASFAP